MTSTPRKHSFLSRLFIRAVHRAALALHAHTHRRADKAEAECLHILATTTDPHSRNEAVHHYEERMVQIKHVHTQSLHLLDQTENLLGIS